ncbi:MAG: hypothetical protein ACI4QA_00145 [Candidatus Spyradosoma sp.]
MPFRIPQKSPEIPLKSRIFASKTTTKQQQVFGGKTHGSPRENLTIRAGEIMLRGIK